MKAVGLLLAGGQSRRMGGGDKALRLLGGVSLLERVIERLRPQVDALVLNANGDPTRFARFGLAVVADSVPGFAGPLAGSRLRRRPCGARAAPVGPKSSLATRGSRAPRGAGADRRTLMRAGLQHAGTPVPVASRAQ